MIRFAASAALAALFATSACKPESARRADRAAKDVTEQREDLVNAARSITDKPSIVEGTKDVIVEASELATAAHEFERQKSRRLAALQGVYDIVATQPGMISVLARDLPITDAARGDINEKLTRLQMRLDETANIIEGLAKVDIDTWEKRNTDATEAIDRLDTARKDTWRALEDAPQQAAAKTDRDAS